MTELRSIASSCEVLVDSQETFVPLPSSDYTFNGKHVPLCQKGEDIYVDLNRDGNFSATDDWIITADGSGMSTELADEIDESPDLFTCWSDSSPNIYPQSYTLQKGRWPRRFTVLASSLERQFTMGPNFFNSLGGKLYSATSPEESYAFFRHFAEGLRIYQTLAENPFSSFAVRLGIVNNREDRSDDPPCSDVGIRCSPGYQDTEGILGRKVGFLYNPETVLEDAQKRYLLIIETDSYDTFWFGYGNYYEREVTKVINDLAEKYQLPSGHVRRISRPANFTDLQKSLEEFSSTVPEGKAAELLAIYVGHGNTENGGWYTTLREGFWPFRDEVTIKEDQFRELFAETFSAEKFPSSTIVVHTCRSGGAL